MKKSVGSGIDFFDVLLGHRRYHEIGRIDETEPNKGKPNKRETKPNDHSRPS